MDKDHEEASKTNGSQDQHEDPVEDNMDEEAAAKEKLTSSDPNKVKFTTVSLDGFDGQNGEAKVDIHVVQTTVGMGKDELMKYANEPFWVRLRMALFILFWIAWIAMLVGAIAIIMLAPRCPPAQQLKWYQKSALYAADIETFKDSDGDGVGDLKGLTSKVGYFKEQNIGTLVLGNIYKTAKESDGVLDHKEIDAKYGTIADFEDLIQEMRKNDIKLILDFVPNHSSHEHTWFQASEEGQEPYTDFYVWADPVNELPPNNWLSVSGGPAWKYSEKRKKFYLHNFEHNKPELNLRNELVKKEFRDVLEFWLDKGVDGFKVVASSHLLEDKDLRDEPLDTSKKVRDPKYKDVNHIYTVDQPENLDLFAEWKQIMRNFSESTGVDKVLLAEVSGSVDSSMQYYGTKTTLLADFPMNKVLTELDQNITATQLKNYIDIWMNSAPEFAWPNWMIGGKGVKRLASRVGPSLVDGIHMVVMLAKGTPITYYGDELGLTEHTQEDHAHHGGKDMFDPTMMNPIMMVWSNETNGGFTNGTSTFMLNADYQTVNVQAQSKDKNSHLSIFKRLLALRNQPALNFGMQEYPLITEDVFSMMRVRKGSPGYLVALNTGQNATVIDFTGTSKYLPEAARVEIRSGNLKDGILADGDHPKVSLNNIPLGPKQAVVFSFVPQFES